MYMYKHLALSPIDNAGWNAARHVFGPDTKQLLCRWHIDK